MRRSRSVPLRLMLYFNVTEMTQETDGNERQQEGNHVRKNEVPDGAIFAPFEVESGKNAAPDGAIFAPFEIESEKNEMPDEAIFAPSEVDSGKNAVPDGTIFAPFEVDSFSAVLDSVIQPNIQQGEASTENKQNSLPAAPKHKRTNAVSLKQLVIHFNCKCNQKCL